MAIDRPEHATLAREKLGELHGIALSVETLRKWMSAAGLWLPRKERHSIRQPRLRRACFGELNQNDGSDHEWFEGRAPRCVLLVFVDDATGKLMELRFCASESTFKYWTSVRRYLERYGRPEVGTGRRNLRRAPGSRLAPMRPERTEFDERARRARATVGVACRVSMEARSGAGLVIRDRSRDASAIANLPLRVSPDPYDRCSLGLRGPREEMRNADWFLAFLKTARQGANLSWRSAFLVAARSSGQTAQQNRSAERAPGVVVAETHGTTMLQDGKTP